MKDTKVALSKWCRETWVHIQSLDVQGGHCEGQKDLFEENPAAENRIVLKYAQAKLRRQLRYEEEYLEKKSWLSMVL